MSLRRRLADRAARTYIAGSEPAHALAVARRLGTPSTVAYWDARGTPPHEVAERNLTLIDGIAQEPIDCYVSVKLPALAFDADLMGEVVARAAAAGVRVHFDSLATDSVDATFDLIADAGDSESDLGCTLPGRWRRSVGDVERALDLGLAVRVVKGQFPAVRGDAVDARSGFLAIVDRLAGRARRVAVATHDARLARAALRRLRAAGTPCELEVVYGLPANPPAAAATAEGARVRVYVACGHGWTPYRIADVAHSRRVLWWVARAVIAGSPRGWKVAQPPP